MDYTQILPQGVKKQGVGPNTMAKLKDASTKAALLRNRGLGRDVDVLEKAIIDAVGSGDYQASMNALGSLNDYYYKSAPKPQGEKEGEREGEEITPDLNVIAERIQDTLRLGEDSNIRISPSHIQNALESELSGDAEGAFKALKSMENEVSETQKIQREEEKEMVTLENGEQVFLGKKSGTIYRGGIPLSQGAINTGIYEQLAGSIAESKGIPYQIAAPVTRPTSTIKRSPELYKQQVSAPESTIEEKNRAFLKAKDLYLAGNDTESIALLNAIGAKGFFGLVEPTDLPRLFGKKEGDTTTEEDSVEADNSKKTRSGTEYLRLD